MLMRSFVVDRSYPAGEALLRVVALVKARIWEAEIVQRHAMDDLAWQEIQMSPTFQGSWQLCPLLQY
jgi:hypothetical protein